MLRKTVYILTMMMLITISKTYAAQTFILDNQHSYVLWKIGHLGFSSQSGKWYVTGIVSLDKKHPQNSKVDVTIDLSKIITGIPELDKHLTGKLFFDIAKFPKATFTSNKVTILSETTANVHGILSLHGSSKPVTLLVSLNKEGKNPITDKVTVGFTGTTELKRSDFGINTLLPDLADKVTIEIGAEAYQANEK